MFEYPFPPPPLPTRRICHPVLQIPSLFQTKKCHFQYLFSSLTFAYSMFNGNIICSLFEVWIFRAMLWFNFILGLNFIFLLFLGMVMYGNEFKTMEIKFKPRIKLNQSSYTHHPIIMPFIILCKITTASCCGKAKLLNNHCISVLILPNLVHLRFSLL